jgi:quercetin dioxygenase-like cupin family protein
MKTGSLLLRLLMVVSFLVLLCDVPLAQSQEVTRTELQRVAVSDLPGREGVMYKGTFAPGGKAAKHTHPVSSFTC